MHPLRDGTPPWKADLVPQSPLLRFAWPAALLLAAIAGTTLTACMMPFVAIAVVATATLPAPRALLTVLAIWSTNQCIGFGLLGYPRTSFAIGWGVATLAASLLAVAATRLLLSPIAEDASQPGRSTPRALVATRLLAAFALAFAAFEGLLYLYAGFAGGRSTFTVAINARIAANDAIWLVALVAFRVLLARTAPRWFGPRLVLQPV